MILRMAYEFGAFRVDPSIRSLSREGHPLVVTPKAFDVLVFLIQHRDEVVSREQLLCGLWPDCNVEDATLSQHVYLLRRQLRSNADESEVIATIPRRGYRFVMSVTERVGHGPNRRHGGAFVGREPELDDLRGLLAQTRTGSQIACITGEPGIGKTALIDAFVQGISLEPQIYVARGRCSERFGNAETYLPLLDVLEDLRRRYGNPVSTALSACAPHWLAHVDAGGRSLESPIPLQSSDQFKRELCAFLEELSRHAVVLLIVDDWHWASESTVELFSYLASKSDRMHLLLVLAYRPEELVSRNSVFMPAKWDWQARGVCHELPVGPLTAEDVERYVLRQLRTQRVPAGLGALLYQRTEGNPLFMVDLLDHGLAERMLFACEGDWTSSGDAFQHDLPESTRSMIDRAFGVLSDADRQILKEASVQGCEFDSAVLAEVSGKDARDVEKQLDALRRRGVVTTIAERTLPDGTPNTSYLFRHVLYQNVLYDSLGGCERAALTRSTAATLVRHGK